MFHLLGWRFNFYQKCAKYATTSNICHVRMSSPIMLNVTWRILTWACLWNPWRMSRLAAGHGIIPGIITGNPGYCIYSIQRLKRNIQFVGKMNKKDSYLLIGSTRSHERSQPIRTAWFPKSIVPQKCMIEWFWAEGKIKFSSNLTI